MQKKWVIAVTLMSVALATEAAPRKRVRAPRQHIAPIYAETMAIQSKVAAEQLIQQPEMRMLGYFNAMGKPMSYADGEGYFRLQVGRTMDGKTVIQDFYQNTRTKQIDPIAVRDQSDANVFYTKAWTGLNTWYASTGELKFFAEYEQGEKIRSAYYAHGRLRLVENTLTGEYARYAYYPNGRLMMSVVEKNGELYGRMYDTHGRLVYDSRRDTRPLLPNSRKARAIQRVMTSVEQLMQDVYAAQEGRDIFRQANEQTKTAQ